MRDAFRRQPVLTTAFALAVLAAFWFAADFAYDLIYWSTHSEVPVQPWMTVGYVGKSWGFDPRVIDTIAGLPLPVEGRPFTLAEIARDRGVPVDQVIADVEAALAQLQAERGAGQ